MVYALGLNLFIETNNTRFKKKCSSKHPDMPGCTQLTQEGHLPPTGTHHRGCEQKRLVTQIVYPLTPYCKLTLTFTRIRTHLETHCIRNIPRSFKVLRKEEQRRPRAPARSACRSLTPPPHNTPLGTRT